MQGPPVSSHNICCLHTWSQFDYLKACAFNGGRSQAANEISSAYTDMTGTKLGFVMVVLEDWQHHQGDLAAPIWTCFAGAQPVRLW